MGWNPDISRNAARSYARRILPRRLWSCWLEDLEQEILLLEVLERRRRRRIPGWLWKQLSIRGMRALFGKNRDNPLKNLSGLVRLSADGTPPLDPEVPMERQVIAEQLLVPARRDSAGLCMRRLQEQWGGFDAPKRAAVMAVLIGEFGAGAELAAEVGVTQQGLRHAHQVAMARIDDPVKNRDRRRRPAKAPGPRRSHRQKEY